MTAGHEIARSIVDASGGEIVGSTRLQKIAYILTRSGFIKNLSFSYHRFGPYSEDLTRSIDDAVHLGHVLRTDHTAIWGGKYSIFRLTNTDSKANKKAKELATFLSSKDAVILELAATAIFLADEGVADAWSELTARKPSKSTPENISKAKELVGQICEFSTPKTLPLL